MERNNKTTIETRTLVFMALLVAMQIILSKVISIDLGFARIMISSLPTILAGLWFGPLAGGLCGMAADILGCLLKGYAVNPLITLSTMTWGIIPALMQPLMKGAKLQKMLYLCLSIVCCAVLGTLVLTTSGLVLMNGYDLRAILPGRLIQCGTMIPVYCVLTNLLYYSPLTALVRGDAARRTV